MWDEAFSGPVPVVSKVLVNDKDEELVTVGAAEVVWRTPFGRLNRGVVTDVQRTPPRLEESRSPATAATAMDLIVTIRLRCYVTDAAALDKRAKQEALRDLMDEAKAFSEGFGQPKPGERLTVLRGSSCASR